MLTHFGIHSGNIDNVKHTRGYLKDIIHEYIPDTLLLRHGDDREKMDKWEADILNRAHEIEASGKSLTDCMGDYVRKSMEHPLFGSTLFEVSMLRDNVEQKYVLAINADGLHIVDRGTRALIVSFPYVSVMRWSRSSTKFNFTTQGDNHWTMLTKEGEEINKFMGIYVRFLLENKD